MDNDKIYGIPNPSQELLIKTIKTIPKEPINGFVQFSANGIKYESFRNKETYLRTCERKNIIPYSRMNFRQDLSQGDLTFSIDQRENLKKYLSGSKIESYLFHLWNISGYPEKTNAGSRLHKIKDSFLPSLMENNYKISKFHLWFGSYVSDSRYGTHAPNIVLNLNNNNNGLQLIVSPDYLFLKDADLFKKIPEIEKWFNSLQERVLF